MDRTICVDTSLGLTKQEKENLNKYVKENITPTDLVTAKNHGGYYSLDGLYYSIDKVREARKKLFPEKYKAAQERNQCKHYKWYERTPI